MRALHRVLMDQPLREKMKERSYRQVTKFSWEKSVRRIMDVYQEVLSAKGSVEPPIRPPERDRKTSAGVA
jgi:glycogen synthase